MKTRTKEIIYTILIILSLSFGIGLTSDPELSIGMHLLGIFLICLFGVLYFIREELY